MVAVGQNSTTLVALLLEKKADVNAQDAVRMIGRCLKVASKSACQLRRFESVSIAFSIPGHSVEAQRCTWRPVITVMV